MSCNSDVRKALSYVAEYLAEVESRTLVRWRVEAFWHLRALCVAILALEGALCGYPGGIPRLVRFRELVVPPTSRGAREHRLASREVSREHRRTMRVSRGGGWRGSGYLIRAGRQRPGGGTSCGQIVWGQVYMCIKGAKRGRRTFSY
eukprot:SAG11_NODE_1583_length_4644_cov_4.084708_5_plen_147_part_00